MPFITRSLELFVITNTEIHLLPISISLIHSSKEGKWFLGSKSITATVNSCGVSLVEVDPGPHMRSCLAPVTVEPTRSTNAASLIPNSFSSSRNAGRPARPGLSPMRTRLPAFNASATLQSPGLTISVREKKGRQWDNSPRCGGVGAYRLAIAFPVLGSYIISAATTSGKTIFSERNQTRGISQKVLSKPK